MLYPKQTASIKRTVNQLDPYPTEADPAPGGPSSAFACAGGVTPSGAEQCYGLQGAAQELCLGAFLDY